MPLQFAGDHYTHTLMTPFFDPGPNPFGTPPVWLGGVGPRMTEVAGEVADGFLVHPFCTDRSLHEITLPALERGRARRSEPGDGGAGVPARDDRHGPTEADQAAAVEAVRAQIAFYASTPAYRVVLDVHGWGDLQPALQERTRAGDWAGMAALVPDDLLERRGHRGRPRRGRRRHRRALRLRARPRRPQRPLRHRPRRLDHRRRRISSAVG